jgi:aspartyl-tRNA(Asn)/glutamyl-tRNA(Gln) amidotransferase subunit C
MIGRGFFRVFLLFSSSSLVVEHGASMSLTRRDVENIAHLARLEISEAQLPVYADSLSKILSFVEQLNAADTGTVEPMAHPLAEQVQRLRPDEVLDIDQHEKFQRNAARVADGLYLVPKVIE